MASRIRKVAVPSEDYDETNPTELLEDEDTEPTPPQRSKRVNSTGISSGWGAPKQERRETVQAPFLDIKSGKKFIKILESQPSVNFFQHYVKSAGRYLSCSQVKEYDESSRRMVIVQHCPLCDAGHKNIQQFKMNVVDMKEPNEVKTWTFGWLVAGILQELHDTNPLDSSKWYFHVWRSKPANGGAWTYTVLPVKARDLEEDHQLEPLTEDQLEDMSSKLYGEETVWINSEKQLQDAANALTDTDFKNN